MPAISFPKQTPSAVVWLALTLAPKGELASRWPQTLSDLEDIDRARCCRRSVARINRTLHHPTILVGWLGKQPDLEVFRALHGSLKWTLLAVLGAWTLAAFRHQPRKKWDHRMYLPTSPESRYR